VKTRLGIVVPHYNQQEYLSRSIQSLKSQDVDCVIAVIDDASLKPPTWDEVFLGEDSTLHRRYIVNSVNLGVQYCRNSGYSFLLGFCDPQYLLFSDADVIWEPGILKRMLDILDGAEDDVAYVYCNYEAKGHLNNVHYAVPFDADQLRKRNFASTMSVVRSDALPDPPFIEDEGRLQDWSLWLRLLNAGYRGAYLPMVGFTAYYTEASISSRGYDDFLYWKQIIRKRYVFNEQ
jgi:glycosyltransferase involved in cell wall biosynthesis